MPNNLIKILKKNDNALDNELIHSNIKTWSTLLKLVNKNILSRLCVITETTNTM